MNFNLINHPKTNIVCIECNRYVNVGHDEKPWGQNHKTYGFGAIIKKRPLTQPAPSHFRLAVLPNSVDLRSVMKAGNFVTFDQGQQGSCTANCGAGDHAFMEIKRADYGPSFSRAFLYAMSRKILGTFPQDSGAEMINIGQALTKYGQCFDKTMPYNQFDYSTYPNDVQFKEASGWVCGAQHQLPTVNDLKAAVYQASVDNTLGAPRLGFPVSESFMDAVNNGGWLRVPGLSEKLLGGHAMLILGYDDNLKFPDGSVGGFIVLNSWGNVGDTSIIPGIFFFPYAWFTSQWIQANGGTDSWQQVNSSAPGPNPGPGPGPNPHPDCWGTFLTEVSAALQTKNLLAIFSALESLLKCLGYLKTPANEQELAAVTALVIDAVWAPMSSKFYAEQDE